MQAMEDHNRVDLSPPWCTPFKFMGKFVVLLEHTTVLLPCSATLYYSNVNH